MTKRGVTLIEILIVIVLIGLMAGFAIPRLGQASLKQSVRSARAAIVSMHAKARANAIQSGRRTVLQVSGGELLITTLNPVTGVLDTVGVPESMRNRYNVSVSADRDSLVFDPRGLGTETGTTYIYVTRSGYADTVRISSAGRVIR